MPAKRVIATPGGKDLTVVRLKDIATWVCVQCQGDGDHEGHKPSGYRVTGMGAYSMARPDKAAALFHMTRGAAVVTINGESYTRWWFSLQADALTQYDKIKSGFGINPS